MQRVAVDLRAIKPSTTATLRCLSRPSALKRVQCQAKTTSSRKTSSNKSSDRTTAANSTASDVNATHQPEARKRTPVQSKSIQERVEALVSFLTPKQEGDAGDLFMICLSMAVLVYMSMQLYRLYAYAHLTMNHYHTMRDLMS